MRDASIATYARHGDMMAAQGCASALQGLRMQEEGAGFYVCVYVYAPTFRCSAYADGVCVCTQLYLKCEVYRIDAVGKYRLQRFFALQPPLTRRSWHTSGQYRRRSYENTRSPYLRPKPPLHSPVVRLTCNQQVWSSNLQGGSNLYIL